MIKTIINYDFNSTLYNNYLELARYQEYSSAEPIATIATIIKITKIIIAILISWEAFTPSTHRGTKLKDKPPTTTAIHPIL